MTKLFRTFLLGILSYRFVGETYFKKCCFRPLAETYTNRFRARFSTKTATLSLMSLIESNRKKKVITCFAFLDKKSAFDAVWHPAILNCLISKNFPPFLVKLLASFLSSRFCSLSSPLVSRVTDIRLGCPHGSVLSPFLWNILHEDL